MGRFFVFFLCLGVILGGNHCRVSAQPLPTSAPKLVLAVFQQLDSTKKLSPLLDLLRAAYTQRTSETSLSAAALKQKLGHYGPPLFGKCKLKASCLSQSMKAHFPSTQFGLFLGVGGLGDAILLNLLLVDLKTGKEVKRLNNAFNNQADLKAKLPLVMKKLFPNYASIRWQGLPPKATVTINGVTHRKPQNWVGVPANQKLLIVLTAPGFLKESKQVQLTANSQITQIVKLKPGSTKPLVRIDKRRNPPPPMTKGQPVTKKWWFWTLVGVATVGVGIGVGVAVASSQNQRKEKGFIPVEVPPL